MTRISPRCAKLYINAVETLRGPDQRQIAAVIAIKFALMCVLSQIGPAECAVGANLTKLAQCLRFS